MKDTITDFEYDFRDIYPEFDYSIIERLLENLFDSFESRTIGDFHISTSIEKIHALQENIFVEITNEVDNISFFLEYENGINNGTQLNGYSFNSDLTPSTRTIEVLKDVVFDYDAWLRANNKQYNEKEKQNLEFVFNANFKQKILKMIREQSYDNYVTGGGTLKTDSYYRELKNELKSKSVYYKLIYKEEEVKPNISHC